MKTFLTKIDAFMKKYSVGVHIFLTAWNLLVAGWATGIPANLEPLGIPYVIDVRSDVSWVQAHTHLPTWVLALVTLAVNATIGYNSWRKSHPQQPNP